MELNDIKQMGVIGAGDMGHGIAEVIALSGIPVYLYDKTQEYLDRGVNRIHGSLEKLFEKGKIDESTYKRSIEMLRPTLDIKEVTKHSQYIIEAVPEVMKIKQSVFRELDEHAPANVILATNTSNMSISQIASSTSNPKRVVGVHFFNPVVMMKLVEVIRGNETSDEVMDISCELCRKFNKVPVRVEKDSPSFIVNRINSPVRTYLGAIVDRGLAQPSEIDALFKYHGQPMGHFELADFVGLDILYDSSKYREEILHEEFGPYRLLEEKINNKEFGKKTGKGFYNWMNGRPKIDVDDRTDIFEFNDLAYIKLNEATKLIENGISSAEDIDIAMELGTGDKVGPIKASRQFNQDEIVNKLDFISQKYEKEVLKPTKFLKEKFNLLYT
ncbi:3-hydroxyacyl-CoA dehydrogenase [Bacillus sp. JJ1562]|uniref:3-hydroxyacyl-CoA dehydrogenase n=1 Tax=Bacillus sp. JJ1562 TaxID=3122960 RepID=UPI0030013982